MNKGLTGELKALFPDITPMTKPEPETGLIIDPHWSVGFISGEGCFSVFITKSQYTKVGYQVQLRFRFTQHIRDVELMESLVSYLGGKVAKSREAVDLNVILFSVLTDKLLPLLEKYPIQGVKFKDYYDFIKVVELVKNKAHLTSEGLSLIRKIKAGMNTGRRYVCETVLRMFFILPLTKYACALPPASFARQGIFELIFFFIYLLV
jgi:hypothetical protein